MATWSCEQLVCCSCRYWTGKREIEFSGTFYQALQPEGKCAYPRGGFRGCMMHEGSSCSFWDSFKGSK